MLLGECVGDVLSAFLKDGGDKVKEESNLF